MDIDELKRLAEAATPGPWHDRCGVLRETNGGVTPIATVYRSFNSQFIAAANPAVILELIRQRDAALGGLGLFMDAVDRPPERNCSCHISPPCNDCVENSGLREAFEYAKEIIANAEKQS